MNGWISIYRQIQDCEIWDSDEPYDFRSAWIFLLLNANHRDKDIVFNYKPMTICRGQYLTSVRKLAEHWHWSKDRVLKYLRLLEELKMIQRDSDSQRTVITIVNYGIYQSDKDTSPDTDNDTDETHRRHKSATNNKRNKENKEINISKPAKKANKFCEIEQQNYDMDELEKQLGN